MGQNTYCKLRGERSEGGQRHPEKTPGAERHDRGACPHRQTCGRRRRGMGAARRYLRRRGWGMWLLSKLPKIWELLGG